MREATKEVSNNWDKWRTTGITGGQGRQVFQTDGCAWLLRRLWAKFVGLVEPRADPDSPWNVSDLRTQGWDHLAANASLEQSICCRSTLVQYV